MKRLTPESALKKLVLDYLAAKRIHVRRNQVGMMDVGGRKVPFGEKGEADCTAYVPITIYSFRTAEYWKRNPHKPDGSEKVFYILHLEFKAPKGVQSAHQKAWQADVEARGEFYLVVKSLDEVIAWLEAHQ